MCPLSNPLSIKFVQGEVKGQRVLVFGVLAANEKFINKILVWECAE